MISEKLKKQIIKFLFVGGSAFLIDMGVFALFNKCFGVYYLIANIISFTVSVIFNYILSVKWVFDVDENKHSKNTELVVFIAMSVIGLGLNELIMYVCVDLIAINEFISKIGATGIVMVYNFITRKLFLE